MLPADAIATRLSSSTKVFQTRITSEMVEKNGDSCLEQIVTLSDIAVLSGYGERTVQRLVKSGVIRLARDAQGRQLKGRFVLGEAMPALCEYLRDLSTVGDPHEEIFRLARSRKMAAMAEIEEQRARLLSGELVSVDHVMRVMAELLSVVRSHVLALPSRCSRLVLGLTTVPAVHAILQKHAELTLREASEFDMMQLASAKPRKRR
jgi:hypothetical protein